MKYYKIRLNKRVTQIYKVDENISYWFMSNKLKVWNGPYLVNDCPNDDKHLSVPERLLKYGFRPEELNEQEVFLEVL